MSVGSIITGIIDTTKDVARDMADTAERVTNLRHGGKDAVTTRIDGDSTFAKSVIHKSGLAEDSTLPNIYGNQERRIRDSAESAITADRAKYQARDALQHVADEACRTGSHTVDTTLVVARQGRGEEGALNTRFMVENAHYECRDSFPVLQREEKVDFAGKVSVKTHTL